MITYNFYKNTIKKRVIVTILLIFLFIEHIPLNETNQAFWKNYSWSKKEFKTNIKESINSIDDKCEVAIVMTKNIKNENAHAFSQATINEIGAQGHLLSMWVTAFKDLRTPAGLTGIIMPEFYLDSTKTYCGTTINIDYSKYKYDLAGRF